MRPKSDGINSLGQTFFVQSIEAFIYSVLGVQANSRFSIVNQGGRSLQTQEIFHKLVGSTIVQNDNTIMSLNYRTAIKDTNVILNQNISPGLLIIPSKLIILKDPIPGYSNSITTSTINMRFGTNNGLNKVMTPIRKRRSEPLSGYSAPINYGSSASRTSGQRGPISSQAHGTNTESKWTPRGFKKTSTPVQGTGENETKKSTDYSMFYFIGSLVLGVIVLEVAISRDGVKVKASSK